MHQPITADEIVRTQFRRGTRTTGYDEIAVDDYLDSVVTAMRTGRFDPASAVSNVTFPQPRGLGRGGYDHAQVDELIERIAVTPPSVGMVDDEGRSIPAAADLTRPSATEAVPIELTGSGGDALPSPYEEGRPGLLRRLFGNH